MQFGYFDNENREYVITNPKTAKITGLHPGSR